MEKKLTELIDKALISSKLYGPFRSAAAVSGGCWMRRQFDPDPNTQPRPRHPHPLRSFSATATT